MKETLSQGYRALNNPVRNITRPAYKFSNKVMRAAGVLGNHLNKVMDYIETGERESKHAPSPISLSEIKRICREMFISETQEK